MIDCSDSSINRWHTIVHRHCKHTTNPPTNRPQGALDQELGRAMEGNKQQVVQGALEEGEKRSFPAKGKAEESMAAAAASSPSAILAFLTRPLSLLRHVAHGCAGYLGGLASRLKPAAAAADAAAAACQPQQEEGTVEVAAVVTVSSLPSII